MNYSQKKQKLQKLIETMVRQELSEIDPQTNTQSVDAESSAAVEKVLKFLEGPQFKSKAASIKSNKHKAQLIVRFAALVGVPSAMKSAIIKQINQLAS